MEESSFPSKATEAGSKEENFPSVCQLVAVEWPRVRGSTQASTLEKALFLREVRMNVVSDQFQPLLDHALQVLCAFIRCAKDGDLPPPLLLAEAESAVRALSSYSCSAQTGES
jgi:hypothetical protein